MKKLKKVSPNTYIEKKVEDFSEAVSETLEAATLPWSKIGRAVLLGAIVHLSVLFVLFTVIVTVRYAIQL